MSDLPFAKKALGQHWLTDIASLQSIVEAADIKAGENVLEIGPGTGTLTDELLSAGAFVTALEFDAQRVEELKRKYKKLDRPALTIQEGDVRSFDLASMSENYKIVANIPYYLTANLLRKLVDDTHKPQTAALLVQKEVAERVTAQPGRLSQIAIFVQVFYKAELGELVPAYLFTPPPKVDSQVLVLKLREKPLFEVTPNFFKVVKAGFSEKRKKLRTSLSSGLAITKDESEVWLRQVEVDPDSRAQELELDDWFRLSKTMP